jgi:hypothetical protein
VLIQISQVKSSYRVSSKSNQSTNGKAAPKPLCSADSDAAGNRQTPYWKPMSSWCGVQHELHAQLQVIRNFAVLMWLCLLLCLHMLQAAWCASVSGLPALSLVVSAQLSTQICTSVTRAGMQRRMWQYMGSSWGMVRLTPLVSWRGIADCTPCLYTQSGLHATMQSSCCCSVPGTVNFNFLMWYKNAFLCGELCCLNIIC